MKKLMGSILFVCLALGSVMAQSTDLKKTDDVASLQKTEMKIEEGVTTQTVIDHYTNVIGGAKAVKSVNSMIYTAEADMGGMIIGYQTKNTTKNQFALAVTVGGNPMQQVKYNGNTGYAMSQGQRTDFDTAQNKDAMMKAQPFLELLAKEAKLERAEMVDGKEAYVVSYGDTGMEAYYDKMSGLKVKETNDEAQMGQKVQTSTLYNEYKEVQGIKIPHAVTQSMGPREITFNVTEILINEGVSDEDFN